MNSSKSWLRGLASLGAGGLLLATSVSASAAPPTATAPGPGGPGSVAAHAGATPPAMARHNPKAANSYLEARVAGGGQGSATAALAVRNSLPQASHLPRVTKPGNPPAKGSSPDPLIQNAPSGNYWVPYGPKSVDTGPQGQNFYAYTFGKVSGRVTSMAFDPTNPSTMYLGTSNGGVWKSIDAGLTWNPTSDNQPSLSIGSIAVDPNNPGTIYAGTGEANFCSSGCTYGVGILKSTDGAATWSLMPNTLFAGPAQGGGADPGGLYNFNRLGTHISTLWVDPANSNRVFAGTTRNGLWATANGTAATPVWAKVTVGPASVIPGEEAITDFAVSTNGTYYAVRGWSRGNLDLTTDAGNGVYVSRDGGATWNRATTGIPTGDGLGRGSVGVSPANPSRVYAVFSDDAINGCDCAQYFGVSNDSGATWTQIPLAHDPFRIFNGQGSYDQYISVDPTNADILYIGGIDVFRSTDAGGSFVDISNGYSFPPVNTVLHTDQHFTKINPNSHNNIYVGNDGGVWSSNDAGGTWTDLNQTLADMTFYAGSAAGNFLALLGVPNAAPTTGPEIFAGAQDNGSQLFNGTSQGWTMPIGGDGSGTVIDPINSQILYGMEGSFIQKSNDGGKTWFYGGKGISGSETHPFNAPIIMDPNNNSHLLSGTTALYETWDAANTWTKIACLDGTATPDLALDCAGGSGKGIQAIALDRGNNNVVWVGQLDGTLSKVTLSGGSAGRTFVSTNYFTSTPNLPTRMVTSIATDPSSSDVWVTYGGFNNPTGPLGACLAADRCGHLFESDDAGATWVDRSPQSAPGPNGVKGSGGQLDSPANSVIIDPSGSHVYVGTDAGFVFSSDFGGTWQSLQSGLPNAPIFQLFTDGTLWGGFSTIFAATNGRGVFAISAADSAEPGTLTVDKNSMSFSQVDGALPGAPRQTFTVTNNGGQTEQVIVSSDYGNNFNGWLCATVSLGSDACGLNSPTTATLAPGQSKTFRVYARQSMFGAPAVPAGTFWGAVQVSANPVGGGLANALGMPQTIPVVLVVTPSGPTFNFAEGATLPGINEKLSMLMPNYSGNATITYYINGAASISKTVSMSAGQVFVENVNADVPPNSEVSATVVLPHQGTVERTLNFTTASWKGSTDVVGVSSQSPSWYFAEGATRPDFNEYLTLQNTNATSVPADLTYVTGLGARVTKKIVLPATSRTTVWVFNGDTTTAVTNCDPVATCGVGRGQDVSVSVVTTDAGPSPIVVERPLYANDTHLPGLGGAIRDGHVSFGATSANTEWDFAEGATQAGFDEYLTIQNPSATTPAKVSLTYLDQSGVLTLKTLTAPAATRVTIPVFKGTETSGACGGDYTGCGVGPGLNGVSVRIASDQPIVAERPMYLYKDFGTGIVAGATDALGANGPAQLYGFSQATTVAGENDYLTIGNPNVTSVTVKVDYYRSGGSGPALITKSFAIPGQTRYTVGLSNIDFGAGPAWSLVGIVVTADQPVLVEKPTYSSNAATYGATDTNGFQPNLASGDTFGTGPLGRG